MHIGVISRLPSLRGGTHRTTLKVAGVAAARAAAVVPGASKAMAPHGVVIRNLAGIIASPGKNLVGETVTSEIVGHL